MQPVRFFLVELTLLCVLFSNLGIHPLVTQEGEGDLLYDADGNSYIDYCMSFGALILGHAHPKITKALIQQIQRGSSYCTLTEYELSLGLKIIQSMPSIEKLRFVCSGTEATMTALRLARAYTGKNTIIKFNGNYHGHSDLLLVQAGSGLSTLPQATSKGVPLNVIKYTISLPYNDCAAIRKFFQENSDIAAVIVEPVCGNTGVIPGSQEFLNTLREETKKSGSVLIFDEVITGFRIGLRGAQDFYGITPDLTCLGKIMGGGFPTAAFGGKKEIMDQLAPLGDVYQAGTLAGNPIAMIAGYTTLCEIEREGFYDELERKMALLVLPLQNYIREKRIPVCLQIANSMLSLFFGCKRVTCKEDLSALDHETFREFFTYLFERGIYIPPSHYEAWFISGAHTEEHLEMTRDHILDFLKKYY